MLFLKNYREKMTVLQNISFNLNKFIFQYKKIPEKLKKYLKPQIVVNRNKLSPCF
jgi:hypothetical protein